MPQAIIRLIPPFDPASERLAADAALTRAAAYRDRAERLLRDLDDSRFQWGQSWLTAQEREDIKRGLLTFGDAPAQVRRCILNAEKCELDAVLAGKNANRKARPAVLEITVVDGYHLKSDLKARGYRFTRDAHYNDLIGMSPSPGWQIVIVQADSAVHEIAWLRTLCVEISGESSLTTLLKAPTEGRPELAGLSNG